MRKIYRYGLLLVLAVAWPTMGSDAQTLITAATPGPRVRIFAPAVSVRWPTQATLEAATADSVVVRDVSEPPPFHGASGIVIPLAHVRRLGAPSCYLIK